MILFGLILIFPFIQAKTLPSSLDQMEHLSTRLKLLSQHLTEQINTSTEESLPMLELESSMIEVENLVQQLENQISNLPPPSSL